MANNTMQHLPAYYKLNDVFINITAANDTELDLIEAFNLEKYVEKFISTATDEGLIRYERDFNLAISPAGKTLAERRALILGKLKGMQTITLFWLKNIVDTITGGDCLILENGYVITIRLNGAYSQINEVIAFVEDIKPAHLRVVYPLNTHEDLAGLGYAPYQPDKFTHEMLSNHSHAALRTIDLILDL